MKRDLKLVFVLIYTARQQDFLTILYQVRCLQNVLKHQEMNEHCIWIYYASIIHNKILPDI